MKKMPLFLSVVVASAVLLAEDGTMAQSGNWGKGSTWGGTAAITEMLIQSHAGYIDLLPALPKAWAKKGFFKGLCARGGFVVDCAWCDGRPVSVAVRGRPDVTGKPDVRFAGRPIGFTWMK